MQPVPDSAPDLLRPRIGLVLGPALFIVLLLLPIPAGMAPEAWSTAAVGALMAVWWITEAVPIPATALVPLVAFPLLGVLPVEAAAAPYADPIIFLFMGGFMLALAMQRWNLHRRVALRIISAMGVRPVNLVAGFMVATAFISMWVSNTATAVMMLPIGLSVVQLIQGENASGESHFQPALMLGIAYAASIGGFATLIGTPPNALLAGFARQAYGVEIGFVEWMMVGVPMTLLVLPLCWILLVRFVFPIRLQQIPGGRELISGELRALGRMTPPEKWVLAVFGLTAFAWITRPLLNDLIPGGALSDAGIGIGAALILFLVPVGRGEFVLNWEWASRLPWDVLLLFGGGLSLAAAIGETGLAGWIGERLGGLDAWPTLLLILAIAVVIVILSEVASNTATAAAFLPVVGSLALGIGEDPFLFAVPAALAASCGFMLPVATPPNAIAYGSGYVTVPQMVRAGFWLDLICIAVVLLLAYLLVPVVFAA